MYRDIRFSPDPTPYKVESVPSFYLFVLLKLMTDSRTSLLHGWRPQSRDVTIVLGEGVGLITNRSRTGRKGPYAGYYVQIAPGGKSFVGKRFPVHIVFFSLSTLLLAPRIDYVCISSVFDSISGVIL